LRRSCFLDLVPIRAPRGQALETAGGHLKTLLPAVDPSFRNRTVFTAVAPGVELIARARGHSRLCLRAPRGSRRFYSPHKFTPEQIRQDKTIPWKIAFLFHGGKRRLVRYKEILGVYWQGGARKRKLRLSVAAPTSCRPRKSGRLHDRRPAFLLTTVLEGLAGPLPQVHFDRRRIEVNHREEKDTLGVGQAQLRNPISVPQQPVLMVAAYSALLLASLKAFGAAREPEYALLPRWRKHASRPSCLELITLLRKEMAEAPDLATQLALNPSYQSLSSAAAARQYVETPGVGTLLRVSRNKWTIPG
jgi:hypothetical protein